MLLLMTLPLQWGGCLDHNFPGVNLVSGESSSQDLHICLHGCFLGVDASTGEGFVGAETSAISFSWSLTLSPAWGSFLWVYALKADAF